MNSSSEVTVETTVGESPFDIETVFLAQYDRVARVIARVVRDPARAEELAVEVFLKLWQTPQAQGKNMKGWISRAAVRKALDELRRRTRRSRYERFIGLWQPMLLAQLKRWMRRLSPIWRYILWRSPTLSICRNDEVRFTGTLTAYQQSPLLLTWDNAKINAEDLPPVPADRKHPV